MQRLLGGSVVFYSVFCSLAKQHHELPTHAVEALGLSRGNLSRWKHGATPSVEMLEAIADRYDVSIDYLLGRTTYPVKPEMQHPGFIYVGHLPERDIRELKLLVSFKTAAKQEKGD